MTDGRAVPIPGSGTGAPGRELHRSGPASSFTTALPAKGTGARTCLSTAWPGSPEIQGGWEELMG